MKWKKYRAQKIASFREVMFFLSYNVWPFFRCVWPFLSVLGFGLILMIPAIRTTKSSLAWQVIKASTSSSSSSTWLATCWGALSFFSSKNSPLFSFSDFRPQPPQAPRRSCHSPLPLGAASPTLRHCQRTPGAMKFDWRDDAWIVHFSHEKRIVKKQKEKEKEGKKLKRPLQGPGKTQISL